MIVIADRGEVAKGSAEIFFRKVKFWKEDGQEEAPPVFVGIILLKNVISGRMLLCRLDKLYALNRIINIFALAIPLGMLSF